MAEYLSPAVYIEEPSSGIKPIQGIGTSVAGFIGIAERGPLAEAVFLTNYGQFITTFGDPIDEGYLAFAVKAFFDEGGGRCYVVRVVTGAAAIARRNFQSPAPADVITVRASSAGTWGNSLSVGVVIPPAPDPTFTLTVSRAGAEIERLTGLTLNPLLPSYAPARVSDLSTYITVQDLTAGAGPRPAALAPQALTLGASGNTGLVTADFIGTEANAAGVHALDAIEDVNLVAVPETVPRDVHVQGMAYCEQRMDCFYVAHVAEMAVTPLEVLAYKRAQGAYAGGNALNSKYGALYAPWIDVVDPRDGSRHRTPPSGAVLGRYARTDATRGVHKAPAGITEGRMASVIGLSTEYGPFDQEALNPQGINVIRNFPGTGYVIWGARTVSSDPEWRYLNVRRLFLFLEGSIKGSTSWTVFEPNDLALWKALVRNVSAFLSLQRRAGALVGATDEEAFFVKCDGENNPIESVLLNRVITDIGVAPSKPAEFVVFRISQWDSGSEVSE